MSVQFGRWNFEGQEPAPGYIEKVSAALAPYGPDSNESYSKGGVKILYRAFHTTKESHREVQPYISPSGAVITWDGRLDNRAELIGELRSLLKTNAAMAHSVGANTVRANSADDFTDVEIVAASYEKWGPACLGRLVGDWALSIWNPGERAVLLAGDPIGTKHLYYSMDKNHVTWSTILDPLVLFAGRTFEICEEYIAGWFAILFPAAHLTPYVGVHAVPPSSSVLLRMGKHGVKHTVTKYWDFDPHKRIRYRTDAEYEEHFRNVFATAVKRRLRSDRPVVAELSGGMDSSSIVCMADLIIARGEADCPRLDTISWFDSSDPNWDDPAYFVKVEEKRGHTGCHIDLAAEKQGEVASEKSFLSEFQSNRIAVAPVPGRRVSSEFFKQAVAYARSQGHRVTLSGIGGEPPTGGAMPTPTPELQDLLARARFFALARQLNAWAVKMRKARLPLLYEAARGFLPLAIVGLPGHIRPAVPWLHPGFVRRNQAALCGYSSRTKLFGHLPSFQDQLRTLAIERRLMAYFAISPEMPCEIRYPYLDRDLREFAYALPREQLVRVGQRRSLMKRALVGIVSDELLNRKQKASLPQEPQKSVSTWWPSMDEIGEHMVSSSLGIVDPDRFLEALQKARRNEEVPIASLKRTLFLESWLRHLTVCGFLTNSISTKKQEYSRDCEGLAKVSKESGDRCLSASAQPKSSAS
jgi:asparagine synthase (glutamine-hydrolysing)